jgi:hypothetical protein
MLVLPDFKPVEGLSLEDFSSVILQELHMINFSATSELTALLLLEA